MARANTGDGRSREIDPGLSCFAEFEEFLAPAVRSGRELFHADVCTLVVLDRQQGGVHVSIAGHDARGDDVDGVFDPTPEGSGRALGVLCVPLSTPSGPIGVLKVVEPAHRHFTVDERQQVEALASQLATACEQGMHSEYVTSHIALRTAGVPMGVGLILAGLSIVGGAVLRQQAVALPLAELLTRPGMWIGPLLLVGGTLLLRLGLRQSRPRARPAVTGNPPNAAASLVSPTMTIREDHAA